MLRWGLDDTRGVVIGVIINMTSEIISTIMLDIPIAYKVWVILRVKY